MLICSTSLNLLTKVKNDILIAQFVVTNLKFFAMLTDCVGQATPQHCVEFTFSFLTNAGREGGKLEFLLFIGLSRCEFR